jgi:hypothetical protein
LNLFRFKKETRKKRKKEKREKRNPKENPKKPVEPTKTMLEDSRKFPKSEKKMKPDQHYS